MTTDRKIFLSDTFLLLSSLCWGLVTAASCWSAWDTIQRAINYHYLDTPAWRNQIALGVTLATFSAVMTLSIVFARGVPLKLWLLLSFIGLGIFAPISFIGAAWCRRCDDGMSVLFAFVPFLFAAVSIYSLVIFVKICRSPGKPLPPSD